MNEGISNMALVERAVLLGSDSFATVLTYKTTSLFDVLSLAKSQDMSHLAKTAYSIHYQPNKISLCLVANCRLALDPLLQDAIETPDVDNLQEAIATRSSA
jgi:archaellum component FlaG (FlaF/FlaG flagellin family)